MRVESVEDFISKYPRSEMEEALYEKLKVKYSNLNDFEVKILVFIKSCLNNYELCSENVFERNDWKEFTQKLLDMLRNFLENRKEVLNEKDVKQVNKLISKLSEDYEYNKYYDEHPEEYYDYYEDY